MCENQLDDTYTHSVREVFGDQTMTGKLMASDAGMGYAALSQAARVSGKRLLHRTPWNNNRNPHDRNPSAYHPPKDPEPPQKP